MKLVPVSRVIAAWAMLIFMLVASSSGAACEARCAQPTTAVHGCCPMQSMATHSGAMVAGVMECHHSATTFFSEFVTPVGLVVAVRSRAPLATGLIYSAGVQPVEPLASPPHLFPLRI